MWDSYLLYQAADLLLALVGMLVVHVWVERIRARRRWSDASILAGTLPRRLLLVEAPILGVIGLLALSLWHALVYPWWYPRFSTATFDGAELTFLIVGALWYAGLALYPGAALLSACRGERFAHGRRRRSVDIVFSLVAVVSCTLFLRHTMVTEPNRLQVEPVRVELADWPREQPPLRIVVLADVQSPLLGARERALPALVESLQPDLILVPGDLVAQSLDPELPLAGGRWLAKRLRARLGVYAVNGDVDRLVPGGLARVLDGTGVQLLDNESVVVNDFLEIVGCDPSQPSAYRERVQEPPRRPVRLGLVHRPRHVYELGREGTDLVVAGHTHGGQIRLPGFGPPVTMSPLPREVAEGGLHEVDGTPLYVSRGIGMEAGFAPPMRLRCPPEVTLLELGPPRETPLAPRPLPLAEHHVEPPLFTPAPRRASLFPAEFSIGREP